MHTPVLLIKVGFKGVFISQTSFRDVMEKGAEENFKAAGERGSRELKHHLVGAKSLLLQATTWWRYVSNTVKCYSRVIYSINKSPRSFKPRSVYKHFKHM